MNDLTFEAEPFELGKSGCGCAKCGRQSEYELEEPEWESAPSVPDKRPRAKSCTTPMPSEVLGCRTAGGGKPDYCSASFTKSCPTIPELWKSLTIGGVPFRYGAKVKRTPGTKKYELLRVKESSHHQEMTPKAWWSLLGWVGMMGSFGMPVAAIVTEGALYCRCIKHPVGKCQEDSTGCTGKSFSNHSFGDAIDISGVVWKDPALVGSSQLATLAHSWADPGDQGQLLRRINAALRLSFATVLDHTFPGHQDHFHVDTNFGAPRPVFGPSPEKRFILESLQRLGYVAAASPVTWPRALDGLTAFATRAGMQPPSKNAPANEWRAVVNRLFSCVALGNPAQCRNVS